MKIDDTSFIDLHGIRFLIGSTLPWAIFRFRIFSNYFWQKFEKIKITVWKSDNLTRYEHFCLYFY